MDEDDVVMATVVSAAPVVRPVYHDVSLGMKVCAFLVIVCLASAIIIVHYIPIGSKTIVFVNMTN